MTTKEALRVLGLALALLVLNGAAIYGCSWAIAHSDPVVDLANQYLDASEAE